MFAPNIIVSPIFNRLHEHLKEGRTSLNIEHSTRKAIQVRITDVPHRVVRRLDVLRVDRQREEPAVRALAPLQVVVDLDQLGGDYVGSCGPDVPEGRAGGHGCPCELDADGAFAGDWVVGGRVVRV